MEDLGHTPVLKSNDLQSLTETLKMRLTEIEFENRFSRFFHEDLPVPLPKNVGSFICPSIKKRSQKRKAPAPPKAQEPQGIINYQLQTLQELGPILAKSVTLPANVNYKVKVKVKSQSQHATLTGYSSLVSVFKVRQTSSLKVRKKTFRKALRKKNKSLGDLFSVSDSTKPPCDIINEENSECLSTNCVEEEGECPQTSSVLQPPLEKSCISPLEITFSDLGILSSMKEQRSPIHEYDKSIVENSHSCICINSNFSNSNFSGLQASSPCKQNSSQFNNSSADMQKSSSSAQDGPSRIKVGLSSGEGHTTCTHKSPSSCKGDAPCMGSSPSTVHNSPSHMLGGLSWVPSSTPMQGSPSHQLVSPSDNFGSQSHQLSCQSHHRGSPSRAQDSPSSIHGSQSRTHGSQSHAHGSQSRAHGSPAQGHCSSFNIQSSPSRLSSTPCHAQDSQAHVCSGPSSNGSPSPVHESPSQLDSSPSCVLNSPCHVRRTNTRMCGYPSWLQESTSVQSIPMQNSPKEVMNSPAIDSEKAITDISNDKLNELENEMEKPFCTLFYKKKLSCEHIYEEVDESYVNLSGLHTSPYPPPVPSNSPCISPETLRHSGYLSDDKLQSVRKMAPQKPPRSKNKEIMLQNWSLASENCSRVEEDICNSRESLDDLDLEKITVNTTDNTGEILSSKYEQEKIKETKKLKTYYFGEKFTPDHSSTRKSLPRQNKKSPSSSISGPRSPGSPSFMAKKPKNKNSRRKFSIPKTFKFSLKTSLGHIRLSGKKFLTRSTRQDSHEKAVSAYKSWQSKKSPAIITPHNVRIPRIVIHVETPEAEDSYGSSEIQEQIEDINVEAGENTHTKSNLPSPVPSVLSLINNYEGCDLSVMGSPSDFYTPQSYLDCEEQEVCSEVEFLGATSRKSNFRSTCFPSDRENDDVICIESVNTRNKNCQPSLAHSQPDLSSMRLGDEEEVIFLGASKSKGRQTGQKRMSIKHSSLLKENPIYFHSYDDLQIILNSN